MRTPEQYKESLKNLRPNVYKFGELIDDVTTHPSTKRTVEGHSQIFKVSLDPEFEEIFTKISPLNGERVSRYLTINESAEDMIFNSRMKREVFNITGTCTGGRCAGYAGINSMWAVTYDIDQAMGTNYHERLKNWLNEAQKQDLAVAGALTDPKGDRSKRPGDQADPEMNLMVVETRDDGVVLRGAKVMICGIAAANEIFLLPGSGYKEGEEAWAFSGVIPKDIEGLTIVEARHPSDRRDDEEGFDNPVSCGGITQAYLLFDDVFVPNERIFMNGETKFTMPTVMNFIAPYRAAIGGCVAGQGDVMIGAAALMARANGLSEKVFNDKITQMVINNETTFGMGIAASAMGSRHPSGVWIPDQLLANVNKVHVARLPYDTKILAQDIAGGIAETGCLPSCQDLDSAEYGDLLKKYLSAACSGETRAKLARLIEWLTLGAGVPGCMHGGGSPDGAKVVIRGSANIQKKMDLARKVGKIEEELVDPKAKR